MATEILQAEAYANYMADLLYDTEKIVHVMGVYSQELALLEQENQGENLVLNYYLNKRRTLTKEEFVKSFYTFSRRQEELLFIGKGRNISAAFLVSEFPAHFRVNGYYDLIYVFEGEAKYFFHDETLLLQKGDVLLIPAEVEHGEKTMGANSKVLSCALRSVFFLSNFLHLVSDNSPLYTLFVSWFDAKEVISYVKFACGEDAELVSLFERLYQEQELKEAYAAKMSDVICSEIFLHLLRNHESQMVLPENARVNWKAEYVGILTYINEHYKEITLSDVARHCGYSTRQLMRIIKECTGKKFKEVITDMRLDDAKRMLHETTLPIEEVAFAVGYENLSSFARVFRERVGMTPSAFRAHNVMI